MWYISAIVFDCCKTLCLLRFTNRTWTSNQVVISIYYYHFFLFNISPMFKIAKTNIIESVLLIKKKLWCTCTTPADNDENTEGGI